MENQRPHNFSKEKVTNAFICWVLPLRMLSIAQVHVFLAMVYAAGRNNVTSISIASLTRRTGLHARTVRLAIRKLVHLRLIQPVESVGNRKAYRTSIHKLYFDPDGAALAKIRDRFEEWKSIRREEKPGTRPPLGEGTHGCLEF